MDTTDFFSLLTGASNYTHNKMEEIKNKGQVIMDNIKFTTDWESKMNAIKSSYDYWEREYGKLQNIETELKKVRK